MKKFLSVLIIAAAITSCSGSGDAAAKTDSAVTSAADTAKKMVDSTIKAVADTAKAKIGAVADSAKKAVKK